MNIYRNGTPVLTCLNDIDGYLDCFEPRDQVILSARCALRSLCLLALDDDLHLGGTVESAFMGTFASVVAATHPASKEAKTFSATFPQILDEQSEYPGVCLFVLGSISSAATAAALYGQKNVQGACSTSLNQFLLSREFVATTAGPDFDFETDLGGPGRRLDNELTHPILADGAALENGMSARRLLTTPLWPHRSPSSDVEVTYSKLHGLLLTGTGMWSFWRHWLQGMVVGQPIDWGLQYNLMITMSQPGVSQARTAKELLTQTARSRFPSTLAIALNPRHRADNPGRGPHSTPAQRSPYSDI